MARKRQLRNDVPPTGRCFVTCLNRYDSFCSDLLGSGSLLHFQPDG
jgi:hypothetical protein